MLKMGAIIVALTAAAPASAGDWRYVDSANDFSNITFIDPQGVTTDAAGITTASMFSVLAKEEDGAIAYRFRIEVQCDAHKSRLVGAESFDANHVSSGETAMEGQWSTVDAGSQGETILKFICSKGAAYPNSASVGTAYPFEPGMRMLAEQRAAKGQ